jgi:hypothetical protein
MCRFCWMDGLFIVGKKCGKNPTLRLVDEDQTGYLACLFLGKTKGTLRPYTDLSRVSFPHFCQGKSVQRLE